MAQFTNQARITYSGGTVTSNIAVGEITEVLSVSKTALSDGYTQGDAVTYVINLVNDGAADITGLTLTDNLGAYAFGETALVPLTPVDGAIQYFADGVLQPDPTVNIGTELVISGIRVPANGNATILYQATANQFAPPTDDGTITNVLTVTGAGSTPLTATETVTAVADTRLSITKSISPIPVAENGELTYTFLIQNSGSSPVTADDDIVLTDVFDPRLSNIRVTLDGVPLTAPADHTYDEASGTFATVSGEITVPAATYAQDPVSGAWVITPGSTTLVVVGDL